MTTVIKIGGSILEPEPAPACAQALAGWAGAGPLAIVHGGGKTLSALLEKLHVTSHFHNGLRITDPATLDAALLALAGGVNKKLVAALNRAWRTLGLRARAVGLTGLDGDCLFAQPLDPALGLVGEPVEGSSALLRSLLDQGLVPVLASLAAVASASPVAAPALNVNADSFAAAIALQLNAKRLLLVTDVAGVLDSEGRLMAQIRLDELESLLATGAIRGGMLPKLDACRLALAGGVTEVQILGAAALTSGVMSGDYPHTRILPARSSAARPVLEAAF